MNFKKILSLVVMAGLVSLVLALTIPSYRNHIFFLNFVDEDDNIVIGNYVAEEKKLYTDVFSQHQPIPFIISASWQKLTKTDNMFMTVKRHREFMIIWSALWLLVVSLRFGWPLLATGGIIELSKITLLGNLFLAESLVVYPLLYVMAYMLKKAKSPVSWERWLVIILLWFLWFSLAPLWPLLGVLFLTLIYQADQKKQALRDIVLVGVVYGICVAPSAGIKEYWHDTIFINYKYYIPLTTPVGLIESLVKAFAAPVVSFGYSAGSQLLGLIKVLSLGFLLGLSWLLKNKHYQTALWLIFLLGLSSLRYIDASNTLYGAFHMLPWFSLLTLLSIHIATQFGKACKSPAIVSVILVLLMSIPAFIVAKVNLWDKRDVDQDYYVHYSPVEDLRKAVEILSRDTPQTVWVEPVLYWPYWRTGAKAYSTMINYYEWMDKTAPLQGRLDKRLEEELPTIAWVEGKPFGLGEYLSKYVAIKRDGKPTNLYLRQDKVKEITLNAREELSYYRFEIDETSFP